MPLALELTALTAYLAATWRLARVSHPRSDSTLLLLLALAIVAQGLTLGLTTTAEGAWQLGLGDALSLFLWQCCVVHLLLCLRMPLWHLGSGLWPAAAGSLVLAWWLPLGTASPSELSASLRAHILLSLLAYALLTLAALQTISYAWQDRRLHRGEHPRHRPPLQVMEAMVFRLLTLGFVLLTTSIATGFLFVENFAAQHLIHKAVLSIIACLLFGLLLLGRSLWGWRGRIAIGWTLGAYASLLLAYFGSKLVLEQILGSSWS